MFLHLLQFFEQTCYAYLVFDYAAQVGYVDSLLLHSVAEAQRHGVVLERVVVYGYAVRCTYGVLAAVTLADRVFLIVLTVEVELQVVDYLAGLFGQSVFLQQRHNA